MAPEAVEHDERRHRGGVPPGIATDRRINFVQRERLGPLRELETALARHPFPSLVMYAATNVPTGLGAFRQPRGPRTVTRGTVAVSAERRAEFRPFFAHGSSATSHPVHSLRSKAGIMFGMDDERQVGAGDETLPAAARAEPADPQEWSVPSRWWVPEPERRALV